MKRLLMLLLLLTAFMLVACGESTNNEENNNANMDSSSTSSDDDEEMASSGSTDDTLAVVKERGKVVCGGNAAVPGFGTQNSDGDFEGFDIDYCKVVAAAVFGDAEAYEIKPVTAANRFDFLRSGDLDILIRNTTWTLSRDTDAGLDFGPVTFYDGQGMMVTKASGITDLDGLDGATICVQQGTTTEKNLADVFDALGIAFTPLVLPDASSTLAAYDDGSCDAITTDKSGLVSQQTILTDPAAHTILDATMSKEPLGPAVRHGDNNWGDIMTWSVYCTIAAEELGISSANIDSMKGSDDKTISGLLGETGEYGAMMGLSDSFCYDVIKTVGNYGEIFARNLGPDTPFDLDRGLNALYTDGGLQYAPPMR